LDVVGELVDARRELPARLLPLLLDQLPVVITSLLRPSVDLLLAVPARISDPLLVLVCDGLGQVCARACVLRLGQRLLLGLASSGHGHLGAPEANFDRIVDSRNGVGDGRGESTEPSVALELADSITAPGDPSTFDNTRRRCGAARSAR
jgi:hypothetical protein